MDEGISATSLKHRDNFNRMIAAAEAGKIDVIVTKAVFRFARNVVDCLTTIRRFSALNPPVVVRFETEGINTLDSDSEMILAVMAAVAQEESKTKSNDMNWSFENHFKKRKFLMPVLLGYDYDEDYCEACESVYDDAELGEASTNDDLLGDFILDGYQVVRSQFFSTASKPIMNISQGKVRFNSVEKSIAVRPCNPKKSNAIRWGKLVESKWQVKPL